MFSALGLSFHHLPDEKTWSLASGLSGRSAASTSIMPPGCLKNFQAYAPVIFSFSAMRNHQWSSSIGFVSIQIPCQLAPPSRLVGYRPTLCVSPSITAFGSSLASFTQAPVSSRDSSFRTSLGWSRARKITSQSMPAASPRDGSRMWCVMGGVHSIGPKVASGNRSSHVLMVVVFSIG